MTGQTFCGIPIIEDERVPVGMAVLVPHGETLEGVLFSASEKDHDEPEFNFSLPEDVMFEVWMEGDKPYIDHTLVLGDPAEGLGAASYEASYGGFLDHRIGDMLEPGSYDGVYVMEGITGHYHKGDGWTTDDDMDFYPGPVRLATPEEVISIWCGAGDFWASERENVA